MHYQHTLELGFDAVNSRGLLRAELIAKGKYVKLFNTIQKKIFGINLLDKHNYKKLLKHLYVKEDSWSNVYPTLLPQYDRSPRSGRKANIIYNSTPENFKKNIALALEKIQDKDDDNKILFLQSWNEWAEGNYIEPDLKYGQKYLKALREMIIIK